MSSTTAIATLLMASLFLVSCQKEEETRPERPRPVLSMVIDPFAEASLTLPGTVEARVETQFGFRILGRVVARYVQVGDLVSKGDVLAAIDPLALELAVSSAQSDLANAQAQLANAITNEERQRTLFERQSGAKATYETAQLERRTAEAAVNKAKANLDKANEQLSYARLVAEFDGVVTATSVEVGQVVSAGQSVVTVAQPDERDAVIDVPETGGAQLQPGAAFEISLQLDPTIRSRGIVREIAPEADDATRTRRTRLTLVDPPEALRLGAVITAHVIDEAQPEIRVPSSAIRMEGSEASVWVVNEADAIVVSRDVVIDVEPAPGAIVTITDGLKAGERIVVAGVNKLQNGQAVRIDQEISQ